MKSEMMIEEKEALASLRNQDWRKIKLETEKLTHYSLISRTERPNLCGKKSVCYKTGIPQRNPKRNNKAGWKIRIEGKIKKLREQSKLLKKGNDIRTQWNKKTEKRSQQPRLKPKWKMYTKKKKQLVKKVDSKDTEIRSIEDIPKQRKKLLPANRWKKA